MKTAQRCQRFEEISTHKQGPMVNFEKHAEDLFTPCCLSLSLCKNDQMPIVLKNIYLTGLLKGVRFTTVRCA